jgi:flagellar basal body rod protein FlgB
MLRALFGPNTVPATLRQGLDETMAAHKAIARRIASAVTSSSQGSQTQGAPGTTNLADDMAALADEQLRYESEARLLKLVYDRLRNSIRG